MIVFDLKCDAGHVFEAWFGSSEDFEGQRARGLVACPVCESASVEKAVMAPRVGAKGNTRPEPKPVVPRPETPVAMARQPDARMKGLLGELAKAQAEMLSKSENVGTRFAEEARAIHACESNERPIHGQATLGDARDLIDEGIPVAPLPLPWRDRTTDN